jgi:dTDP-4-dehydrorhamnose 3,5-epimerase
VTFHETALAGVLEVHIEPKLDARGYFARTWCRNEFAAHGLNSRLVQCSVSSNTRTGTLRGVHYQARPHGETKLVRCTRGAIYDVVVDLRPSSPTFKNWFGVELTANNGAMVYIPEGCGHGFMTLQDESEIFYQMSEFYHPDAAGGVRWNDPAFGIVWPGKAEVISDRDRTYPDFDPAKWTC